MLTILLLFLLFHCYISSACITILLLFNESTSLHLPWPFIYACPLWSYGSTSMGWLHQYRATATTMSLRIIHILICRANCYPDNTISMHYPINLLIYTGRQWPLWGQGPHIYSKWQSLGTLKRLAMALTLLLLLLLWDPTCTCLISMPVDGLHQVRHVRMCHRHEFTHTHTCAHAHTHTQRSCRHYPTHT